MTAALLRVCTMRYEVQFLGLAHPIDGSHFCRTINCAILFGADKNGLFIEREDAERCACVFTSSIINEVEVPPDYNGEQDHA